MTTNDLLANLMKIDIAILVAVLGLVLSAWENIKSAGKEQAKIQAQNVAAVQESEKRQIILIQKLNFLGERLDKIEIWISANSGIRGSR